MSNDFYEITQALKILAQSGLDNNSIIEYLDRKRRLMKNMETFENAKYKIYES